jgi:hypothetical protein
VVDCHVTATSVATLVQPKVMMLPPPTKTATVIDRFPCVAGPKPQPRPLQLQLPAIGPLSLAVKTWEQQGWMGATAIGRPS